MNMKPVLATFIMSAFAAVGCFAETDEERNVTVSLDNGDALFSVGEGAAQQTIELSDNADFSRIVGYVTSSGKSSPPYKLRMKAENRIYGKYYFRILENSKYYYGYDRTVTYGSKEETAYVPITDETEFDDLDLGDATTMKLTSVWFRSTAAGNPLYKSIDHPLLSDTTTQFTPNQGAVVKDNVIYVCRGASPYISGWVSDKSRVWLERYDLLTGEELPMLWVKSPDTDGYLKDGWVLLNGMDWIGEDSDGTPYFTFIYRSSEKTGVTNVVLYTLDLDGITTETTEIKPNVALDFQYDGISHRPSIMTVEGSIASNNYRLWGVNYTNDPGFDVNGLSETKLPVWRWIVTAGTVVEKEVSYINYVASLYDGELLPINYIYARILPIGDNYFFLHAGAEQVGDPWISPMLYSYEKDGNCTTIGHHGNCKDIVTSVFPAPAGVSVFTVTGTTMIAYGQGLADKSGTGVQIVTTPSLTDDFSGHKKLWMLGGKTGLSSNRVQGCQVTYIPDATPETGGRLLMYAANGGAGLYRIDRVSPTVGIDTGYENNDLSARYDNGEIVLSHSVDGIVVSDMAGRIVYRNMHRSDRYATGNLSSGHYILSITSSSTPLRLSVR